VDGGVEGSTVAIGETVGNTVGAELGYALGVLVGNGEGAEFMVLIDV